MPANHRTRPSLNHVAHLREATRMAPLFTLRVQAQAQLTGQRAARSMPQLWPRLTVRSRWIAAATCVSHQSARVIRGCCPTRSSSDHPHSPALWATALPRVALDFERSSPKWTPVRRRRARQIKT
jgi:hypothetical protein